MNLKIMIKRLVFFVLFFALLLPNSFAAFPQSFSDIVKKEKSKVVHVLNTSVSKTTQVPQIFQDFFGQQAPQQNRRQTAGSGFFVSPDTSVSKTTQVPQIFQDFFGQQAPPQANSFGFWILC